LTLIIASPSLPAFVTLPLHHTGENDVARVRMIEPNEANSVTRRVYDGVLKQWGRISNFSKVLAHQPAALEGWMLPNEMIRLANIKSDPDYVKIQQLVIIKTSALNQSAYCMSHNVPLGKKIGLTAEQIAAAQGDDYMNSPALDAARKRPCAGRTSSPA
jgi:alkylhydroperoxidase family enzyme